jgi:hypothetical protein
LTNADSVYLVFGVTVTAWVHCALSLLDAAPASADVPEWALPVTTLPVLPHDQPVRPDSKPGLTIVFTSAAAGPPMRATAPAAAAATATAGAPTAKRRLYLRMNRSFASPAPGFYDHRCNRTRNPMSRFLNYWFMYR